MTESGGRLEAVFSRPEWTSVRAFVDGLQRSVGGVVRVMGGLGGCTGWLITDTLVVIPDYALGPEQAPRLECVLPGEPGPVTAATVFRSPPGPEGTPALLRLPRPFPGRALTLATTALVRGEPLMLLHHPQLVADVQISHGRVVAASGSLQFTHDAPTTAGSGGAPVLSVGATAVLGVHYAATLGVGSNDGAGRGIGQALGLSSVLASLRESEAWPEIAAAHRLADVGSAVAPRRGPPPEAPSGSPSRSPSEPADDALLRAALTWTLDPARLSVVDRGRIEPWIDDPDEPTWTLATPERRRIVGSARSLEALRRVHDPAAEPGPGGDTVTRILEGPPYRLDDVPDEQLPFWLQAVSWFDELVPELPRPADVQQTLAVRRVRSRLRDSTSPQLWGRDVELARLHAWFAEPDPPPMAVSGIGGIGKSALVARFALDLPRSTVTLWLDFDRADLSPDNAVSVVVALAEQIGVQRPDFATSTLPPVDAANWRSVATSLSSALADDVALLVLDGFEVAQHVQRHEELWDVLEEVVGRTRTRVLISGRAPVPGLVLSGREVAPLPLTGIPDDAARAWLADRGVADPSVVAAVLRAAGGLPLLLKLALRLVETGEDLPSTLDRLPSDLVSGFLYRRILNRVGTPRIRALARDALLLRRLTRDVVADVLHDRIPPGLDADQVFSLLARDLALVEGAESVARAPSAAGAESAGAWLRLRPEVRVATLRLLETEDPARNREIDHRAARWYGDHAPAPTAPRGEQAASAAERVYHLARAGDLEAAQEAWLDGCEDLLVDADQEVPDAFPAAREWLRDKLVGTSYRSGAGTAPGDPPSLAEWEAQVLRRIRDALARGLDRAVPGFLEENSARSDLSPLLIYDAWVLRTSGRIEEARDLLQRGGTAPGAVGWGRAVVAARTAVLHGDFEAADRQLAGVDPTATSVEPDHALAVTAARIRLAIDLPAEARALLEGSDSGSAFAAGLAPWDLILPTPYGFFRRDTYHRFPPVSESESAMAELAQAMDSIRESIVPRGLPPSPSVARLADLSARRWGLVVESGFFVEVLRALGVGRFVDPLRLSLAGTLASFWSADLRYENGIPLTEVARRATDAAGVTRADPANGEQFERMHAALEVVTRLDPKNGLRQTLAGFAGTGPFLWSSLPSQGWKDGSNCALLVAFGPDPLEELERRALGLPELKAK